MTKRYITLFIVVIVATGLLVGHALGIQFTSTVPGSVDDPLVTKGYVDERIRTATVDVSKIEQDLNNKKVQLEKDMENKLKEYERKIDDILTNAIGNSGGNELVVVQLFPGDVLRGLAGTEMIVRSGRTLVVAEENGIPDVTAGRDLAKGTVVPLNHQLIIPRTDGRGIKADSSSTAAVYVMVRGGFELQRAQ